MNPLDFANNARLPLIRGVVRGALAGLILALIIFVPAILVGVW